MDILNSPTFGSNFTEFNNLVKKLKDKERDIQYHVDVVDTIDGKSKSSQLQMVSYNYQYLIFFMICILMFLYFYRTLTDGDTSKIDTVVLLIIVLLFVHYIYSTYYH